MIDPLRLEEIPQAVLAQVAQLSAVWKSAAGQLLDRWDSRIWLPYPAESSRERRLRSAAR